MLEGSFQERQYTVRRLGTGTRLKRKPREFEVRGVYNAPKQLAVERFGTADDIEQFFGYARLTGAVSE